MGYKVNEGLEDKYLPSLHQGTIEVTGRFEIAGVGFDEFKRIEVTCCGF